MYGIFCLLRGQGCTQWWIIEPPYVNNNNKNHKSMSADEHRNRRKRESRTGYIGKRTGRVYTCQERLNKSLLHVTLSCHCHQMFCIWHSQSTGPPLLNSLCWWKKLEKNQAWPREECPCVGKSQHGTGWIPLNWILVIEGNWLKKSISKACYYSVNEPVRTRKFLKLVPTLQHPHS